MWGTMCARVSRPKAHLRRPSSEPVRSLRSMARFLRCFEFHRFFTEFSERPVNARAISDHRLPMTAWIVGGGLRLAMVEMGSREWVAARARWRWIVEGRGGALEEASAYARARARVCVCVEGGGTSARQHACARVLMANRAPAAR